MVSYTVEQLRDDGPQYAMALLLNALESGEPFVTYGSIKRELENQWAVDTIFPTQIGHVAGSLMNQILELDENAPLINVLITRGNGIPEQGFQVIFMIDTENESIKTLILCLRTSK